jgi:hypothetical protein
MAVSKVVWLPFLLQAGKQSVGETDVDLQVPLYFCSS